MRQVRHLQQLVAKHLLVLVQFIAEQLALLLVSGCLFLGGFCLRTLALPYESAYLFCYLVLFGKSGVEFFLRITTLFVEVYYLVYHLLCLCEVFLLQPFDDCLAVFDYILQCKHILSLCTLNKKANVDTVDNNIDCKGNGFFAKKCSNHSIRHRIKVLFH